MNLVATGFKDLFVLEPKLFADDRGYFMESYSHKTLSEFNLNINFVQDNQSSSKRGVLRGLHFQRPPYSQTKLVRVLSGKILDVVVDLRKNQPTFKKYFSIEISSQNNKQILVPKGFAHGFLVLSEYAEVFYKCDEYYNPGSESGIRFNDPSIAIDWKISPDELILSDKDKALPLLQELKFNFE